MGCRSHHVYPVSSHIYLYRYLYTYIYVPVFSNQNNIYYMNITASVDSHRSMLRPRMYCLKELLQPNSNFPLPSGIEYPIMVLQ